MQNGHSTAIKEVLPFFFPIWGISLSLFFFLFYNFYWSTVDLESRGIRCLHSYFSLFLTLTNSMLTHLGVCVPFFFLLLFHHNQDSIIR